MLSLLKEWLARKELAKLTRIESTLQEYRRWLAEFPMVRMVLENLLIEVEGKQSLDACHPPFPTGPWTVDNLRYQLRKKLQSDEEHKSDMDEDWRKEFDKKHEQLVAETARSKELQRKLDEAAAMVVEQNRTINTLRLLCGEAHQQSRQLSFLDEKVLEKMFEASINQSVTTDKDAS